MHIRRAQEHDLAGIYDIGEASWWATYPDYVPLPVIEQGLAEWWSPEVLGARLDGQYVTLVLVDDEDDVWGMLTGQPVYRRGGAWVDRLYLHPEITGSGWGRALLEVYIESLDENTPYLELDLFEGNDRALAFYEKLGFVVVERMVENYFGYGVPMLILRLPMTL